MTIAEDAATLTLIFKISFAVIFIYLGYRWQNRKKKVEKK